MRTPPCSRQRLSVPKVGLRSCIALVCLMLVNCGFIDWLGGKQIKRQYCEQHPGNQECQQTYPDADTRCRSNAACMAPTAVCDLAGSMMCVQCVAPDQTAACTGKTPACGSDRACHACSKHDDCPLSSACLPDGSCATETDVAYVDPAQGSGATCSLAMPCKKVSDALATNRRYVKLTGMIDEAVTINNQNVTILAAPNTTLTHSMPGVIMRVDGTSMVQIFDLTITGGLGATGVGISMPTGNMASLDLERVTVNSNAGGGISMGGGTLTVSRSEISANNGGGVQMTTDGVIVLTNNFIHHNGNNINGAFGGLSLRPAAASRVQFNTIVDNQANIGAASAAGGVFCDVPGFVADDNLIFRNTGGTSTTTQTFGSCTYGNSFVAAGTSAADNTPQFKHPNLSPFDYRLTANTPTTIRDAAGNCSIVDFDGYQRPFGAACDLGASEYHP